MSTPSRFDDKEYTNWIKCNLALTRFKEGLHDFIKTEVANFHAYIQQKIANIPCGSSAGSHCISCRWKSIKYRGGQQGGWYIICQNKICDKWLPQILLEHNNPQNRSINWKNADIRKWPTDGYEVAKVYMPKGQDKTKNLPDDFDASAVLSLLKYCTWFSRKVQTTSILSDLIDFRNAVMHSGDLRVTDSMTKSCIDKMIQLLSELNIHGDVCTELKKMKREDIDINFQETEVRALQSLVSSIKDKMDSLQDAQTQQVQDIEEVKGNTMETEGKVVIMEAGIEGVKFEVGKLRERYQKVKSFLANNPDIDCMSISGNIKAIEKTVMGMESKFEKKIQEIETQINSIGEDTRGIKRKFAEIDDKMETKKPAVLEGPRLSRRFKFSNKTLSQQTSLLQEKRDCPTFAQITKGIHATYSAVDRTRLSHLSGRLSALLKRRERNEKVSVWPGTDLAESKTVFVCLYQGDMQKTKKYYKSIDIYYRDSEQLSRHLEPPHKMPVKNELNLSHENAKLLQQAIEEHGIDLFKHHTNLEAITGSSYILSKSKGYINCPSVVLYCRVKGIAPIGEDAFPKNLKVGDENKLVRIDVREGYFTHGIYKESTFCRTDWHDKLRMGTSIGAEAFDQGTLGPFVKISNTDTGFVTCAHVLIKDPRDKSALEQSLGLKVYQPADNESHSKYEKPREERYCGDVSRIVFNPNVCDPVNGLSKTVGVDAALVIVKGNRNADIRSFPFIPDKDLKNAGFEPSHPPAFRHGSVAKYPLNFNEILGKRVIKYGRTTGLTRGTLGLDGTMVKVKDSLLKLNRTKETVLMMGQYTVEGTGKNPFFQPGDSGSGIFLLDEKNKLTCIGLGIGYIHDFCDCYTVVTPIEYVLKALGLPLDSMQFEKGTAVLEMTKSRTSVDPCISPSSGIERRSRRKRKANQTISIRKHCPSSANPFPEKRRKN